VALAGLGIAVVKALVAKKSMSAKSKIVLPERKLAEAGFNSKPSSSGGTLLSVPLPVKKR